MWNFRHDDSIEKMLPKLVQKNLETGRVYVVASGEHEGKTYPSITRILKARPKKHLDAWKKRIGADKAAQIASRASVRGSSLHTLAERFLGNLDLPKVGPTVMELWNHLNPWLQQHVTCVYAQEVDLFSDKLGVAGRTDLLADVDEILSIVDFKQADRPKKEEWITDYYLQGSFYAASVYERTGRKVKRVIFPISSPEGLQVFEIKPMDHFPKLLSRVNEYYQVYAEADLLPESVSR